MGEYKSPIKMRSDDPICSASALGNAVIGILFDKKGSEIKEAVSARVTAIDGKVQEYGSVIAKIEGFIDEKRKVLKGLDDFYQEQSDKRESLLTPYRKEMETLRKEYNDKVGNVSKKMDASSTTFDKATHKEIGKKAVEFEESFDKFKGTFSEIDEFLKKEEDKAIATGAQGVRGYNGPAGIQGQTGCQGIRNYLDSTSGTISSNSGSGYTFTTSGSVGIGVDSPSTMLNIYNATREDEAVARLESLRNLLAKYVRKIELLREMTQSLNEEKRRLELIARNIDPIREYKLDLNKLSAFGFEDIQ